MTFEKLNRFSRCTGDVQLLQGVHHAAAPLRPAVRLREQDDAHLDEALPEGEMYITIERLLGTKGHHAN